MKIATLSFELKGKEMALRSSKRFLIILNILKLQRPDLLVTSGFSLHNNKDLENLLVELKKNENKSWILVEVEKEDSIIKKGHPLKNKYPQKNIEAGTHNLYIISNKNEILNLGPQYFAQSNEVSGKENKHRILEFENNLENRQFNINDKKVLVLCCGEINSIKGRDNITYISDKVKTYIETSDIILNPTHDCMANYGTLKAKRMFLSKRDNKNTLYINSSNWNTHKERNNGKIIKQNPRNSFMQNIFFNGEKVEMKRDISSDYLTHVKNIEF